VDLLRLCRRSSFKMSPRTCSEFLKLNTHTHTHINNRMQMGCLALVEKSNKYKGHTFNR
jgi:hypothetical protein